MKRVWILAIGVLMTLPGSDATAQTGTGADIRSDSPTSDPAVYAGVTHSQQFDTPAVQGNSTPAPNWGIGGFFEGGYTAVEAYADIAATGALEARYAVYGFGANSDFNIGVEGDAEGGDGSTNYGVYGYASCIGASCTEYAVYAAGDIAYTGSIIDASDLKLKEDVTALGRTLDKLSDLRVVTYTHKLDPEFEHMNLPVGRKVGFIAQEVAEVYPDLVIEATHPPRRQTGGSKELGDPIRYQAIETMQMIPILVKAIQEQQAQIEALTSQIAPLKKRLAELEGSQSLPTVTTASP